LATASPSRERRILDRVVLVDVKVANGLARDVDQRVARQLLDHMIEEADARWTREYSPVPSRLTVTSIEVSLRRALDVAVRMGAPIAPIFRMQGDSPPMTR
jgi:hypothetical protein